MNIYKQSTQSQNWIFSQDALHKFQVDKFRKPLAIIKELAEKFGSDGQPHISNRKSIVIKYKYISNRRRQRANNLLH